MKRPNPLTPVPCPLKTAPTRPPIPRSSKTAGKLYAGSGFDNNVANASPMRKARVEPRYMPPKVHKKVFHFGVLVGMYRE